MFDKPKIQIAGSLLMFSATSLQPAEQYFFAVKAVNPVGESDENIIEVVTSSVRGKLFYSYLNISRREQIAFHWSSIT